MPEYEVNGKTIRLRDAYPAKEFYDLFAQWGALWRDEGTFEEQVKTMQRFIVGWDLPGDPQDVKSWEDLDAIVELGPIKQTIHRLVSERIQAAKNAVSRPGER